MMATINSEGNGRRSWQPRYGKLRGLAFLVWCLRNNYTFVALKLAWGEARGRECIRSDTRPTEQRSPRPISAQPEGRHVFWAEALLLAPYRSAVGYARRSRLASAQNPLPRMYSYFGDTTLAWCPLNPSGDTPRGQVRVSRLGFRHSFGIRHSAFGLCAGAEDAQFV